MRLRAGQKYIKSAFLRFLLKLKRTSCRFGD
nr:MAG TPA: hypothetical protein [Caudoviricetes sp.]